MLNLNRKLLALLLVCALLAAAGVNAFAAGTAARSETTPAASAPETAAADEAETGDGSACKDETVYVLTAADGTVSRVIVSDWLKNTSGAAVLNDRSELTDIENVKGDETFTQTGADTVWQANGSDIYYRGTADKALPIRMELTCTLDGAPIAPEDLAGKSGRVSLRYTYYNDLTVPAEVDGKQTEVHVPFAVVTGLLLDTDRFTNVAVTNGKLINDGTRTAVVGLVLPGLAEDLALPESDLTLPDYVEITADVTDFALGMTLTVATNEPFTKLDADKLTDLDGLSDALGRMQEAMTALCDGSDQLLDGLETLLEKSGELQDGVKELADGAKALKSGAGDLADGAKQVSGGASTLSAGLNTLSANSSQLRGGAKQVFDTLLSTAAEQIKASGLSVPTLTVSNYASVLNKLIASLDKNAVYQQALKTVTDAVEAQRGAVRQAVTEAVRAEVLPQVEAAVRAEVQTQVEAAVRDQVAAQVIPAATNGQMTKEQYDQALAAGLIDEATKEAIEAAIDAQMATDAVQAQVAAAVEAQMQSEAVQSKLASALEAQMAGPTVQAIIDQNTEEQVQKLIAEHMASDEVQAKLAAASDGAKQLISLKASLDSYNAFYLGLNSYTAGVDRAAAGAATLKAGAATLSGGASQLEAGSKELYSGAKTLRDAVPALTDGVEQLRDGAKALSDGLHQFDEEAVEQLVEALDGDLNGLLARARAIAGAAEAYASYSGLADGMTGAVRFIYRTEEIGNE